MGRGKKRATQRGIPHRGSGVSRGKFIFTIFEGDTAPPEGVSSVLVDLLQEPDEVHAGDQQLQGVETKVSNVEREGRENLLALTYIDLIPQDTRWIGVTRSSVYGV